MHYYTSNCVSGTQIHFWIYITVLRRFVPKYYYSASPKKALFLCYAPYYIFMPMNLLKETCVQKFHVTYLLKSVTRMTLFQELILLTFGSFRNLEKFWSKYRRFLSCNWPFLLAKNVPFFTSIHNVHNKRQGPKSYICTGLLLSPSLSKEMEQSRVGSIGIPTSISICTTTTSTTKCNQKRYYYYYMSNPFLN